MRIEEALAFIQAAGWLGCRPGLERITGLMRLLGDPQKDLRCVHITGTNGKGSTAAMLSSILKEAGYRVGTFTSPHLCRYHERIRINGAEITDGDLCAETEKVRAAVERMETVPTEFERFTAIGLCYFRERECDLVVLEVGMGGEKDSTNVIPAPEAAVLTNIGLEHTEYLGDTLEAVAETKAGIIKPGTGGAVLCKQSRIVEETVRRRCAGCGVALRVTEEPRLRSRDLTGQRFDYRERRDLRLGLLGDHQVRNAAAALDTVDMLSRRGWSVPEEAVRRGLASAVWPGRFEVLRTEPLVLVDGAHNPDGTEALASCLRTYLPGRKYTMVMGVMADKDYERMLDIMAPLAERFITVTPDSERALSSEALGERIQRRFALPVQAAGTVENGLKRALEENAGAVLAFGSLYQVGAVRGFFGK